MAKPVAARTSSAAACRTSATSRTSATLSGSIRCSPEATQTTGSPSQTKTIDLAISASSQPTAFAASPTVRVESWSCWTVTSRPSVRAMSTTFPRILLELTLRAGRSYRAASRLRLGGELDAGRLGQLGERLAEVLGKGLEVPEQVVVAHEAEVDAAVVAHEGDAEALVAGQRDHREGLLELPAEQVERELRAGHVRDDEVEEALPCHQPGRLTHHRGRGEAAELGQDLRPHGLAALLEALELLADHVQPGERLVAPDRQRRHHRRDPVAEGAALEIGADAHRNHRLELEAVGVLALAAQMASQRAGDRRQHDVVDGPAELVLDRLQVGQLGAYPGKAAVGADWLVVGAARGGVDPRPGHRADPDGGLSGALQQAARAAYGGAGRAGDLGGNGRPLDEGLAEKLGPRGQRPRQPAVAGVRRRGRLGRCVEQHGDDVHARDPVDERVMGLGQDGEAATLEPLDQPQLPERLVPVERLGEDTPRERLELVLGAGGGEGRRAHVVAQVEVRVVDPLRPALP